jgi:hypothetical protein
VLKVNIDMFGYIDNSGLKQLLDSDPELKAYVDNEMDRMADEGIIKKCPSCGGCPSHEAPSRGGASSKNGCGRGGCCGHDDSSEAAYATQGASDEVQGTADEVRSTSYLCCAASCILDYYLPSHVKEILHLNSALSLEE